MVLAAAMLLCCGTESGHAGASEVLAPGYRPAPDTEEGGLWAQMDRQEAELKVSPALVTDEALNTYVRKIVCELAGDYCASLRVYIVDEANSNAFTAPNGMVVVWTGLLLRCQNEAELAFVLGHEITHYLKRHSLLNLQKEIQTNGSFAGLTAAGGIGRLFEQVAAARIASHSRDQEREADAGGFDLVVDKGYDPGQGAFFMANTAEEEEANPNRTKQAAYRASHPDMKERLTVLTKRADDIGAQPHANIVGAEAYRAAIGPHRAAWLEEEFNRGEFAESVAMIKQLLKDEPQSGELQYYLGEAYRRRNANGDLKSAMTAYQAAIAAKDAPNAAHRGLGLVSLKANQKTAARDEFQKYLSLAPMASDRATVEYYLATIGGSP
jgi:predicted Zn-dependent protease